VLVSIALAAGPVGSQSRDEFLRFNVAVDSIELAYPLAAEGGPRSVFFEGEPVTLRFQVWNNTSESVELENGAAGWYGVSLRTEARKLNDEAVKLATRILGRLPRSGEDPPRQALVLPTNGVDEVAAELRQSSGGPLPIGLYRVAANLAPTAFSARSMARLRHLRHRLSAEDDFVVVPVASRTDQMNFLLHMAVRCNLGDDTTQATVWLERLLAVNPSSIPAFAQLGAVARRLGDCPRAIAHWTQARQLLEARADPENVVYRKGRRGVEEQREALARQIANCRGR
jgi:tetratricopeptide (TPR) repeat protein